MCPLSWNVFLDLQCDSSVYAFLVFCCARTYMNTFMHPRSEKEGFYSIRIIAS